MGNSVPSATRKIFALSSIPNHRITSGISARCGMLRIICTGLSSSRSPQRDSPEIKPNTRPRPPPMASPMKARQLLMARCCQISPLPRSVQPASSTALGAGRMRLDNQPLLTDSCHRVSSSIGKSQGASRRASGWEACISVSSALRCGRQDVVGDHFAERTDVLPVLGLLWLGQFQMREQQLGDPVGLLQVRVAGKNEGVDAQVSVFADALGHRWPVTYQCRTGTAPYQADPGPEIGADFQVVLTAAVQSGHAPLAD